MHATTTRHSRRAAMTAALLTTLALIPLVAAPVAAKPPSGAAYWTAERLANAQPRDFIRTSDGTFEQVKARPEKGKPGGGGSTGNVTGASWTAGGRIDTASGKVWFTMDGGDYVCSAAVVADTNASRSLVITAAHCAYDEVEEAFATNWTFIPDFDNNPTYTCSQNTYGCWEATSLVVHDGYASAGGFNDQAVRYDFAVAVVEEGTRGGQLDAINGANSFPINYNFVSAGETLHAFGYPAAGRYKGRDLVYCKGPIGTDAQAGNATWGMPCGMTGGSSGGPWLKGFDEATGGASAGTLGSLNSYGYGNTAVMYGPKFNDATRLVVDTARTIVSGNRIVP